jgi:ubiquinone/menaquinone biosynthesis C-methylase UbiE
MVAVARQKLKSFPKVEFVVTAFEDWTEPESEFDLVISAQAFHWVSKETGYAKAARVLKPGGNIALFWNTPMDLEGELFEALNKVYQAYVPEMSKRHRHSYKQATQLQVKEITEDGYFGGVEIRSYPWSARYTTEEYIGLLGTYSDHLRLPEDQRNQLFEGVTQVLHQHGGFIERPYEAVAFIAGKIH